MTARSDAHQCEVCGTYAFHGFKQKDGDFLWYCLKHRLEDYKMPDLAPPPPELKGQMTFNLGVVVDRDVAFRRYDDRDWQTRFMAWLRYKTEYGETGTAESFRFKAERVIGPPFDDHHVGSVILRAANEGLFERAGHGRMRSKKAHGRETPLWKRTTQP